MLCVCAWPTIAQQVYSYCQIYKTLKADEILISLLAIKREGCEIRLHIARKNGSGKPKALSRRDEICRQNVKTSENMTLLRGTITRRLFNAGFVCICVKKPLVSHKTSETFLTEYRRFDSKQFSFVER